MEQRARTQVSAAAMEQYKRELMEQARRGAPTQTYAPAQYAAQMAYAEQPAAEVHNEAQPLKNETPTERFEDAAEQFAQSERPLAGIASAAAKGIGLGIEALDDRLERRREERRAQQKPQPAPVTNNINIDVDPAQYFDANVAPGINISPRMTNAGAAISSAGGGVPQSVPQKPSIPATPSIPTKPAIPTRPPSPPKPVCLPIRPVPPAKPIPPVIQLPIAPPVGCIIPPNNCITPPNNCAVPPGCCVTPPACCEPVPPVTPYPCHRPVEPCDCNTSLRPQPRTCPVHGTRNVKKPGAAAKSNRHPVQMSATAAAEAEQRFIFRPRPPRPPVPSPPRPPIIQPAPNCPVPPICVCPVPPFNQIPFPQQPQPRAYEDTPTQSTQENPAWYMQPAEGANYAEAYEYVPAAEVFAENAYMDGMPRGEYPYDVPSNTVAMASSTDATDYANTLAKVAFVDPAYPPPIAGRTDAGGTWELQSAPFASPDDFLAKNTGRGILTLQAQAENGAPLQGADVKVIKTIGGVTYQFYDVKTDAGGNAGRLQLPAPGQQYSNMPPQGTAPYALYDVTVTHNNTPETLRNVVIFADTESMQTVRAGQGDVNEVLYTM